MSSTFLGLNISLRGLYSSQNSLYVTNNNISKANETGYSRQVVVQESTTPELTYNGTGMIGTGSKTLSVERVRSEYLDCKYWSESAELGEYDVKQDMLDQIESIMGETTDYGYNTAMNEFCEALEDLSVDSTSEAARTIVEKKAQALCEYFNTASSSLKELQSDINNSIKLKVDEVNSLTSRMASLNKQIYSAQINNDSANELMDQRDLLVDELSAFAEVEVSQTITGKLPNGDDDIKFQISIGGTAVVSHSKSYELECSENSNGMYSINLKGSGKEVEVTGAELKRYLDIRDGNGEDGQYKGIEYYIDQLDECARVFAKAFNEGVFSDGSSEYSGHAGGTGLEGSSGIRFFTYSGLSSEEFTDGVDIDSAYANITAANISVSEDIENDVDKIAAASIDGGSANNENVNELLDIFKDRGMFSEGSMEDFMNSIVSTLGTQAQSAGRIYESQENIISYIENKRLSVSSVSTDEEAVNLVKYQQAYTAAAKMMQVWKQIYDVTIEELGS